MRYTHYVKPLRGQYFLRWMAITRALSIMVSVAKFERKKMNKRQIEGINRAQVERV